MLKNYIDEDYLRGIQPDLENYRWNEQQDFSNYFIQAENEIYEDLRKKNLSLNKLMPELLLRDSGVLISSAGVYIGDTVHDDMNRMRIVYDVTVFQAITSMILTIKGSNDGNTFNTVDELEVYELGTKSIRFTDLYPYYRYELTTVEGSVDLKVYMVETTYDNLFAYKILELIMRNCKKEINDAMHLKEIDYMKKYNEAIQTTSFIESGTEGFNKTGYNTIKMYK